MPLFLRFGFAAFLGVVFAGPLLALDELNSFTLDLPFSANAATPSWLGHPQNLSTTFATLNVPIQPSDPKASLLVTVFFQEKMGGFLRINWQGNVGAQSLSENFYEGIGMANQRSLLISPEILQGSGTLVFQCGDTALGIQRIRFQWLENQGALVSPEINDTLVAPSPGIPQLAQILNGQPVLAESPAWQGRLVRVPVTDAPERIEQGVEFSVQLDAVPTEGRLVVKEDGLPWGKRLGVWINQQKAGTISPYVPDLEDGGFPSDPTSAAYIGWREGAMYLPASFLKVGANTVQFAAEDDTPSENAPSSASTEILPLAVKDIVLQLSYAGTDSANPPPPVTPAPDAPAPDAASTNSTQPASPDISVPGSVSQDPPPTNAP